MANGVARLTADTPCSPASHVAAALTPYGAIAAVTVLVGATSLFWPFGRDQGTYAFIGHAMLQGQIPYLDVFQAKPPLTPIVHAAAQTLFGHTMAAIRLLDLLWSVATAMLLYRLALVALGERMIALVAALCFAYLYYAFGFWDTAITDGWTNLPVLAGLLMAARALSGGGAATDREWMFAGACFALAALLKYTIALVLVAVAVYALWRLRRQPAVILRAAVFGAAGFIAPLLAAAIGLVAAGAWPAFVEIQRMMADYATLQLQRQPLWPLVAPLATLYANWGAFLIFGLLGCGLVFARAIVPRRGGARAEREQGALTPMFMLLWLLAAYGSAWWQGKFFAYHLLPMVPPLAVLGAIGIDYLVRPVLALSRQIAIRGAVVLACAGVLVASTPLPRSAYAAWRLASGQLAESEYWQGSAFNFRTFYLRDIAAVADHIRRTTAADDKLFVWSFEPMIYFLAERDPVSRFIFDFPLSGAYAPAQFRDELMAAVGAEPPLVMVVQHREPMVPVMGHAKDSYQSWQEFTALRRFVEENYRLETTVGTFDLYRRI